jgi:hypothetical protein
MCGPLARSSAALQKSAGSGDAWLTRVGSSSCLAARSGPQPGREETLSCGLFDLPIFAQERRTLSRVVLNGVGISGQSCRMAEFGRHSRATFCGSFKIVGLPRASSLRPRREHHVVLEERPSRPKAIDTTISTDLHKSARRLVGKLKSNRLYLPKTLAAEDGSADYRGAGNLARATGVQTSAIEISIGSERLFLDDHSCSSAVRQAF